jgi:ABC-2 type transport system permease protein
MFGSAAVQMYLSGHPDTTDKKFAVVDRTPGQKLFPRLQEAADERNKSDKVVDPNTKQPIKPRFILEEIAPSDDKEDDVLMQRLELSDDVSNGKYWGFVDIGPDAIRMPMSRTESLAAHKKSENDRRALRYQTNHPTYEDFPQWLQIALVEAIVQERVGIHINGRMSEQSAALQLSRKGLTQRDPATGKIGDPPVIHLIARFLMPAGLVALMFMMIMLSSTPAMHGVVEEKMQRIAEVLLGSVSPFQLMCGKLVGLMGVSLTVTAVYLGGAYWAAEYYGLTEFLPPHVLAWFIVFQILAVIMYGSLFLAVGAAATDVKETQTLVLPIMLIACLPMFILRNALEDPNSTLVVSASFFPPITPMLMMARVAIPPGPIWWQPIVSVALALVITALCVYAAGRIFRVGILMQGKGARLGQMLQWVFRG